MSEVRWRPSPGDLVEILTTKATYSLARIETWGDRTFTVSYVVIDDGVPVRKKDSINIGDLKRLQEIDQSAANS